MINNVAMFLLAAVSFAYVSCEKPEETPTVTPEFPEAVTQALEKDGSYELEITPNLDWTIELKYDESLSSGWFWIDDADSQVYTLSGKAGEKTTIKVCAGPQEDFDNAHTCTLELTMGGQTKTIATFTRGNIERVFTLAVVKISEGEFDYNEDETSDDMYAYNEPLSGENKTIAIEMTGNGFWTPVKIEANFEWVLAEKPEWIQSVDLVPSQTKEWYIKPADDKLPLDATTASLSFKPKDSAEPVYEYTLSFSGVKDIFEIDFAEESDVNAAGGFYSQRSGEYGDPTMGARGAVAGVNGTVIYKLAVVKELSGSFLDAEESNISWMSATLSDWVDGEGTLQERLIEVFVTENTDQKNGREGYILAVPAHKCPNTAYGLVSAADPMAIAAEYEQYIVTHITQAAAAVTGGFLSAYDPAGMQEEGTTFKQSAASWMLSDITAALGSDFNYEEVYELTYTNKFAGTANAASDLLSKKAVDHVKLYTADAEGNLTEMDKYDEWVEWTYYAADGTINVTMAPFFASEPVPSMNFEGTNANVAVMLLYETADSQYPYAAVYCLYAEPVASASVGFLYADMGMGEMITAAGATLTPVSMENYQQVMMEYAEYDLNIGYDEIINGQEIYILKYTSPDAATMAALKIPANVMMNMIMDAEKTPWLTIDEETPGTLGVFMEKPTAEQNQYGKIQIYASMNPINIYCIPAFEATAE